MPRRVTRRPVRRSIPAPDAPAPLPTVTRATAATPGAVLDAAIATMALAIDTIHADIVLISQGKGGDSKHDRASRVAFLATRAGAIAESMRKHEAAHLKRLEAITPTLVLAWFRQLDRTDREHILRELSVIEGRKSGLA